MPFLLDMASSREPKGPPWTSNNSSMALVFKSCLIRRIVDAGELHQDFGFGIAATALLHAGFGQAQAVDLLFDGVDALDQRILAQLEGFAGLHGQAVIGLINGGENPDAAEILIDGVAEIAA